MHKSATGIYTLLPLGLRVLNKIKKIVDLEMHKVGSNRLSMPLLLSSDLWKETGRWETTGDELMRLEDRKKHSYCLGPTHEESFTDLVRQTIKSYRDLPLILHQIDRKYRDELRPRFGLLRSREFVMKDAYSFHASQEDALETYDVMADAYSRIFDKLRCDWVKVKADSGNIGGDMTHEFHILSKVGEDELVICPGQDCDYASNVETAEASCGDTCPACNSSKLTSKRGIEVGQVFYLGDKYTKKESLDATFTNKTGQQQHLEMGCYGIGISRIIAAVAEHHHDEHGPTWPDIIAPYRAVIMTATKNPDLIKSSKDIFKRLKSESAFGEDVVLDDRWNERMGYKLSEAELVGYPYIIVVGREMLPGKGSGHVEVKFRHKERKTELIDPDVLQDVLLNT